MPSEVINIEKFYSGLISNPDSEDIPIDAASSSTNVDGDYKEGILRAVYVDSVKSTADVKNATIGEFIQKTSSVWDFIYYNPTAAKVQAYTDFFGTPGTSDLIITVHSSSSPIFIRNNKELHVGMGSTSNNPTKWIGYVDYGQFGGSAPVALQAINAELSAPTGTPVAVQNKNEHTRVEEDYFQAVGFPGGKIYAYKVSFTYDGYQESPLGTYIASGTITDYTKSSAGFTIRVTVAGYASLNKRISAVNVYRSESVFSGWSSDTAFGAYRLIKEIDATVSSGWTVSGADIYYDFTDNGKWGASYEARTGMPETLTSTMINYSLGCIANNELVVGNCYHASIKSDSARMLIKSKSLRYDTFDWSSDYLILPVIPKALVYFNGRIFAFSNNDTFVINPAGFYIEDKLDGMGCYGKESVVITEYGMFWCDANNIYHHDGNQIKAIGNPIKTDWQTKVSTVYSLPKMRFYSIKNTIILVCEETDGLDTSYFTYHIPRERWDYIFNSTYAYKGLFTDYQGLAYITNGTNLSELFLGSSYRDLTWISKEITGDNPSQKKIFNKIIVDSSGAGTLTGYYGLDGATPATSFTSGSYINVYGKTIKIKLTTTGIKEIHSIALIQRPMLGAR